MADRPLSLDGRLHIRRTSSPGWYTEKRDLAIAADIRAVLSCRVVGHGLPDTGTGFRVHPGSASWPGWQDPEGLPVLPRWSSA